MVQIPSITELMKAGVHFGHQSSKWHPKMANFIFGVKNGVHIIDLEKTQKQLEVVQKYMDDIVSKNGKILFVGTKNQVQETMKQQAERCGMPFLTERWVGGFLTNFSIVIKQTKKLKNLVQKRDSGELQKYTKKEQLGFEKEIQKLDSVIGGVKDVEKLPEALFIWDIKKEKTAVKEAMVKKIPIIAICDTNCNPKGITHVIPCNDDGTKAILLITAFIADCIIESKKKAPKPEAENKDAKPGPAKKNEKTQKK